MPPSDDLKAAAASNQDFYALLDISPAAAEPEIRRAYRRTALKYHPDKIANPTPADLDKFHLLQIANDVLSDPAVRQLYDNAREARVRKQRERDTMDSAKRKMREDLEARERAGAAGVGAQRGVKRTWTTADATTTGGGGDDDAEEKLQREIERIAQDGRRRRREAEERLRREMEEEERLQRHEQEEEQRAADRSNHRVDRSQEGGGANISMLERSVKVRWVKEARGLEIDKDRLVSLLAPFGKIEDAFTMKDKKQRIGDRREKKLIGTGVVVYSSIVSAHAAVLDGQKKIRQKHTDNDDWTPIESVSWASGTAPDLGMGETDRPSTSTPTHPPSSSSTPSEPTAAAETGNNNKPSFNFPGINTSAPGGAAKNTPGKAPSFASFSSAAANANQPKTPLADEQAKKPSTPSLEEVTMMRLKTAQQEKERKAIEEELRREDEAADAAEAAAAAAKT